MPRVYWIEDEIDLLSGAFSMLEDEVGKGAVEVFENVLAVEQSINRIKAQPGPVILDLWIPPGDLMSPPGLRRGPDVGLRLLETLQNQANLGREWAIFIVSGNISFDIKEKLLEKYGIPMERIISKPLNQKVDILVDLVALATRQMGTSS
jgi:CheY-like chemotaxis protein